ncbi:uncharacterized protein LOC143921154 [Arctopsyche grandis]|uniref:uncharacterized protein LOC143921154 n=1 Tax=Arctopsyche grandis TaxID=121162 RepID=UPI00406D95B6
MDLGVLHSTNLHAPGYRRCGIPEGFTVRRPVLTSSRCVFCLLHTSLFTIVVTDLETAYLSSVFRCSVCRSWISSTIIMSKGVLEEFINIYQNSPCLWRIKSKDYHNRNKRDAAYNKLINKLKEIEPSANKDFVVKKINNLRSNARKEAKKVMESKSTGMGADVYEPKLWYYHLFDFLVNQHNQRASQSNMSSDNELENVECNSEFMPPIDSASEDAVDVSDGASHSVINDDPTPNSPVSTSIPHTRTRPPKRPYSNEALATDVLKTVKEHFKCPDDNQDFFAKNVGKVLREVTKMQRIIAEKLIGEVLFHAQMGTLNTSHTFTSS